MIEGLKTLLEYFRDERHHRTTQEDHALNAFSKAINETKLYLDTIRRTGASSRATEETLSRLWTEAAIPVRHVNRELAERCLAKSEYWVNPSHWSEEEIEKNGIGIDEIQLQLNQLIKPQASNRRPQLPAVPNMVKLDVQKDQVEAKHKNGVEPRAPSYTSAFDYTARDICLELRECAPLQRSGHASAFKGWHVDWDLMLFESALSAETVSLVLNPCEDGGTDTTVRCNVCLSKYPQLQTMSPGVILRITGKIKNATEWNLDLTEATIRFPTDEELRGTRVRFLIDAVRWELGNKISNSITNRSVDACIKSQIEMGRLKGFVLRERSMIYPEVQRGSDAYKMLVLKTCKHLLESNQGGLNVADKIFNLEHEIYELENNGGILGF